MKGLESSLKTAISYPKDRGNASKQPVLAPVVSATLKLIQATMKYRLIGMLNRARADAAMLHLSIISPETVRTVHEAGGSIYAWTVDDLPTLRRVRSLGVDGIVSNYPELFGQLA